MFFSENITILLIVTKIIKKRKKYFAVPLGYSFSKLSDSKSPFLNILSWFLILEEAFKKNSLKILTK